MAGEVGRYLRSGMSDGLEQLDLLARRDRHDRLAPAGDGPHLAATAALLLGLDPHDPDADDGHLELGLDRLADLELVGLAADVERVVVALGLGDALLADHGAHQDVVQARPHAYTSWTRSSASCVNTIVSASSRSTTFRLPASRTRTSRRLRQDRSTTGSRSASTTSTLP